MVKRDASRRRTLAAVAMVLGMVVSLALSASPACFGSAPAEAFETSGATYGAGANPTGDPVGGGPGYSHYYSPSGATVVTTPAELTSALAAATPGDVVWIPNGATITIPGEYGRTVKSGVVLASNRGQDGAAGGKIKWTYMDGSGMEALLLLQSSSTLSGLTLEGPIATGSMQGGHGASCIGLRGIDGASSIEVENCEISKFAWAGMYFNSGNLDESTRHHIHHCYIHNCQRHGLGYGIAEEGSCAYLAECNIFRENRHHIMAQAGSTHPNSYEVRYNIFYEAKYANNGDVNGRWYYSHQVDCHGCGSSSSCHAGNVLNIHHNTFYDNPGKPNVCIRGIPKTLCEISWNWTTKKGTDSRQNADSAVWSQWVSGSAYQRMTVHDNAYGGTTPPAQPSIVTGNTPEPPATPAGEATAQASLAYQYSAATSDADSDPLEYVFDWGDGTNSSLQEVPSGTTATVEHTWAEPGTYTVTVTAMDAEGLVSEPSPGLTVTVVGPAEPGATEPAEPASPETPLPTSTVAPAAEAVTDNGALPPAVPDEVSPTVNEGTAVSSGEGPEDEGLPAPAEAPRPGTGLWPIVSAAAAAGAAVFLASRLAMRWRKRRPPV